MDKTTRQLLEEAQEAVEAWEYGDGSYWDASRRLDALHMWLHHGYPDFIADSGQYAYSELDRMTTLLADR